MLQSVSSRECFLFNMSLDVLFGYTSYVQSYNATSISYIPSLY